MTPKPERLSDTVTLYEGDCLEVLPALSPGSVDAVVTDPPYGLGDKWNGGGGSTHSTWKFKPAEAKSWDGAISPLVIELPKMARQTIIWGGNYYPLPPRRCWLIWDKCQPDTWTTGQAELAWTNLDKPVRVFRMCQAVAHDEMRPKTHPAQKPLSLMRWCMKWIPDATTIIDPFAGSGTTAIAAMKEGRRCVLIEKDPAYCEIIRRRVREADGTAPGTLFSAATEKPDLFAGVQA